jgi:hypothetical protein
VDPAAEEVASTDRRRLGWAIESDDAAAVRWGELERIFTHRDQ